MVETTRDPNLHVYNAREMAAHYAALDYLSSCEPLHFKTFLKPGMNILDLGAGGGRLPVSTCHRRPLYRR